MWTPDATAHVPMRNAMLPLSPLRLSTRLRVSPASAPRRSAPSSLIDATQSRIRRTYSSRAGIVWRHSRSSETVGVSTVLFLACAAPAVHALSSTESADKVNCESVVTEDENPLWPAGVPSDMVNRYVDEILADPAINMKLVPDAIERILYVTCVRLTLNAVYEGLSGVHGTELLGHRVVLERIHVPGNDPGLDFAHNSGKIDSKALETLATELLKNKAINQLWLPDIFERQVYANCLRVVFTILDKVADTMGVHMCGHELSLSFEPLTPERARELADRRSREGHRSRGIDDDTLDALVDEAVEESLNADQSSVARSFLHGSFIRALHRSLYSLILGIMDDLLAKTELVVLEDRIRMKLVPDRTAVHIPGQVLSGEVLGRGDDEGVIDELRRELEESRVREVRARRTVAAMTVVAGAVAILSTTSGRWG